MTRKEFEKKWLETFAPNLTKKLYRKYYVEQNLWHIFSFEVVPKEKVLVGDAARKAYEKVDKDDALTIQIWRKKETTIIHELEKDWREIDAVPEFFVVGKNWDWTYVSTHENDYCGLGPYFYKID